MVRVRFAPSPTGFLHLGNVRTALFNYLFAKRSGGEFILRVEDTDQERSRDEYQQAMIEDLAWMGIRWDEGPGVEGEFGPYRQSERLEIYQSYIKKLLAEGKAYYCFVTEEETEEIKRLARLEKRPPRFDNRGRYFSEQEIAARKAKGIKPTVRFKIENPMLQMHDLIRGGVKFNLDEMVGDFVIQRADGMPTFHLAVCVDDALMKITHVIRGEDHLSNTPKHILLLEAMGFKPPQYGHLSLVHGPGGEPLSKRLESVSVRVFRKKGYLPAALANYIALLGWSPGDNREIFTWQELQQIFDLGRVGKSASIFDPHKLDWVNGEHLKLLSVQDYKKRAFVFLHENKVPIENPDAMEKVLLKLKNEIHRFEELLDMFSFLQSDEEYGKRLEKEFNKRGDIYNILMKGQGVTASAAEILATLNSEGETLFQELVDTLSSKRPEKGKDLYGPLRVSVTGRLHGTELKRIFHLLNKASIQKRFESARRLSSN